MHHPTIRRTIHTVIQGESFPLEDRPAAKMAHGADRVPHQHGAMFLVFGPVPADSRRRPADLELAGVHGATAGAGIDKCWAPWDTAHAFRHGGLGARLVRRP